MSIHKLFAVVSGLILTLAMFLPAARADDWNQMTKLKFNQPVEVPGEVLPAGTYWFVLENLSSDRNVVQIFSSNWSREYATLITVPTDRREPTSRTEVKFAERRHDQPGAILKWYYPGRLTGHEFIYPKKEERLLAHDPKIELKARPLNAAANAAASGM